MQQAKCLTAIVEKVTHRNHFSVDALHFFFSLVKEVPGDIFVNEKQSGCDF
jgi:hypothetical protein